MDRRVGLGWQKFVCLFVHWVDTWEVIILTRWKGDESVMYEETYKNRVYIGPFLFFFVLYVCMYVYLTCMMRWYGKWNSTLYDYRIPPQLPNIE